MEFVKGILDLHHGISPATHDVTLRLEERWVPSCSLPFGFPPIQEDLTDQLNNLLDFPEKLPIHSLDFVQKTLPRSPNPKSLYHFDILPPPTTLQVERDASTGLIVDFVEVVKPDNVTKTSTEHEENQSSLLSNSLFEEFLISPLGTINASSDNGLLDVTFDISEVLTEHGISLEDDRVDHSKKANSQSSNINKKHAQETLEMENSSLDINEIMKNKPEIPVLAISDTRTSTETSFSKLYKWAVYVNVIQPVDNFNTLLPKMAREWPFELDTFQKQAILKLESHDSVFVAAHTSAGKTVVAEYAIALALKHGTRVIYTSPVKALSNQKFRDFKMTFSDVGLLTGDIQINEKASCIIMTTEILRSMLYRSAETIRDLEWVIFDEVHYINDPERGVVWEEVLIMLPEQVKLVMLSATVSNTMELADWVGRTKNKKIYVISTLKRPVPLEHYLYTGSIGKTQNEKFLIVDSNNQFLDHKFNQAKDVKEERMSKSSQNYGSKGTKYHVSLNQDKNIYRGLIAHLQKNDKLPVICFTLSRKRCNLSAELLSGLDLTTATEKSAIHKFFRKSISNLKPPDQKLPQILCMENYLKQGFGIHHSGILPVLKEIVEMLFQEGLIKVLFATETFSMGVNMPARSVVFDSIRKHDGKEFRPLISSEYIQMAGRAGRRGLDTTGTVIILIKGEMPPIATLKVMMLGKPPIMESKFRITYSMVLNLLRARQLKVEEVLKRSFREAGMQRAKGETELQLKLLTNELASIIPLECAYCEDIDSYYTALQSYADLRTQFINHLLATDNGKLFYTGRVITISTGQHPNVLATILNCNYQKRTVGVFCLTRKDKAVDAKKAISSQPFTNKIYHDKKGGYDVLLNMDIQCITKISPTVITLSKKKSQKLRNEAVEDLGLAMQPDLQAIADDVKVLPWCSVSELDLELVEMRKELSSNEVVLESFSCIRCPQFTEHYKLSLQNLIIKDKLNQTKRLLSDENLQLLPNYKSCVQVLTELGYISEQRMLHMKGLVACEISNYEILLTELLSSNYFADKSTAEIAGLLTCFVFQMKTSVEPDMTKQLKQGCKVILDTAKSIEAIQNRNGLQNEPDYKLVEELKFGLTMVVHEWAKGVAFAEIALMTDVDEGIIVRTIQRLTEIMKDIRNAAHTFGNDTLKAKMEDAIEAVKRDIVFTTSLYTQ